MATLQTRSETMLSSLQAVTEIKLNAIPTAAPLMLLLLATAQEQKH
jgi:hypothetical protein